MAFTLAEIVSRLGGRVEGDGSLVIDGVAPLDAAKSGQISFLANPKYRSQLEDTSASAIVVDEGMTLPDGVTAIRSPNPYLFFARVVALFNPPRQFSAGISAAASVEGDVAPSAHVAAGAVIEAGAVVEDEAVIGPNCVVLSGARIGKRTRLVANVTVYERCIVGDDCLLHAGVVIGADGFGFARTESREWVKFPQIGSVRIGNKVELGSNTSVDRGAMADTVIEDGVKIDNLVQIAHNVEVGAHTAIAGSAGIAGSSKVGKRCMIGGQSGIAGHLTLCDDVIVSGDTLISKSIAKPGYYTANLPQQTHADWVKNFSHLRHLDAMAKKIRTIEKRLDKGDDES